MIQISIASKSIKYLEIYLHKEEKELHFENYDTEKSNLLLKGKTSRIYLCSLLLLLSA